MTITPPTPATPLSGFGWRLRITRCAAEQVLWFPVLLIAFVITVTGAGLSLVAVGLPIFKAGLVLTRLAADRHRTLAALVTGTALPDPHRPLPETGWLRRLRAQAEDPMTWRELLWILVAAAVGFPLAVIVFVLFVTVAGGLVWWFAAPALMGLRATLDRVLLYYARAEQLETRVAQLIETRAEAVDHSTFELRRIERDLHDGAQARLVALSMTLGQADDVYEQDAELARKMIKDARSTTHAALSDLRSVVRSIHPPVLADRGLGGAIESLAIDMAVPVETTIKLTGRPPASVETAVYFAVAEALANLGKHSRRSACVGHPAAPVPAGRRTGERRAGGGDRGRRQGRR